MPSAWDTINSIYGRPTGLDGLEDRYLAGPVGRERLEEGRLESPSADVRGPLEEQSPGRQTAAELATNMALGFAGSSNPIRAYHGSPHKFDRFDMSRIGSGEGAQSYGHGLYFAENPKVAQEYRDALSAGILSNADIRFLNKIIDEAGPNRWKIEEAIHDLGNGPRDPQVQALWKYIETGTRPGVGHMYEVNIHADPNKMLDWDVNIASQPNNVFDALREIYGSGRNRGVGVGRWNAGDPVSHAVPRSPELTARLREAGIPGIRYRDAMSRGKESGTSNYVIFDDKLIEILRRYGILPPVAAGVGAGAAASSPQESN